VSSARLVVCVHKEEQRLEERKAREAKDQKAQQARRREAEVENF
jgi:hypothetical protein